MTFLIYTGESPLLVFPNQDWEQQRKFMSRTFSQLGWGKSFKVEQLVQLETRDIAEELLASDGIFDLKV